MSLLILLFLLLFLFFFYSSHLPRRRLPPQNGGGGRNRASASTHCIFSPSPDVVYPPQRRGRGRTTVNQPFDLSPSTHKAFSPPPPTKREGVNNNIGDSNKPRPFLISRRRFPPQTERGEREHQRQQTAPFLCVPVPRYHSQVCIFFIFFFSHL